jgi:hypothetical protein
MGIFNFLFGKRKYDDYLPPDKLDLFNSLKLLGPKYLRKHLTTPLPELASASKIKHSDIEWVGQLISSSQNIYFEIKYYGDIMNREYIAYCKEGVAKVVAVDTKTKEEILLFDKAYHGYDGFMGEVYEEDRKKTRIPDKKYVSKKGSDKFQIVLHVYYNHGIREAIADDADSKKMIEFEDGISMPMQDAFDDAFDGLNVIAIDENGNKFTIILEELA